MSLLLEAFLNEEFGTTEQFVQGFAGFVKIGDIVSDLYFIKTLSDYNGIYHDVEHRPNVVGYIAAAVIFTSIGVGFDLYRAWIVLKEWRELSKEEREERNKDKDRWKRWNRLNLWLEEIPQLTLLIVFHVDVEERKFCDIYGDKETDDDYYADAIRCGEEQTTYSKELNNSMVVSLIFTLFAAILRAARQPNGCRCRRQGDKVDEVILTQTTTEKSDSNGNKITITERTDPSGQRVSTLKRTEAPAGPDGFRIVTEEFTNEVGDKTVTVTNESAV